jgi:hypothetical protein
LVVPAAAFLLLALTAHAQESGAALGLTLMDANPDEADGGMPSPAARVAIGHSSLPYRNAEVAAVKAVPNPASEAAKTLALN